jgi:hypothetical protein
MSQLQVLEKRNMISTAQEYLAKMLHSIQTHNRLHSLYRHHLFVYECLFLGRSLHPCNCLKQHGGKTCTVFECLNISALRSP